MARPVYIARAKIKDDPPIWQNIGAAFVAQFKDGDGLSVQLQTMPFGWDGNFILIPPKEEQ